MINVYQHFYLKKIEEQNLQSDNTKEKVCVLFSR
jgi:hypothetical protein